MHIMPPSADFIISIHAPTRGATGKRSYKKEFQHISIHAPTRGATVKIILWVSTSTFQSTLPRGERQMVTYFDEKHCRISIHAPTRGATIMVTAAGTAIPNFNPRSHEGSDFAVSSFMLLLIDFNPRSHEGSDGHYHVRCMPASYFNPRSHEGSDAVTVESSLLTSIFQSTLPRGERPSLLPTESTVQNISIHAPTRGATKKQMHLFSLN